MAQQNVALRPMAALGSVVIDRAQGMGGADARKVAELGTAVASAEPHIATEIDHAVMQTTAAPYTAICDVTDKIAVGVFITSFFDLHSLPR